jgi:hypothetical protein
VPLDFPSPSSTLLLLYHCSQHLVRYVALADALAVSGYIVRMGSLEVLQTLDDGVEREKRRHDGTEGPRLGSRPVLDLSLGLAPTSPALNQRGDGGYQCQR